jgi:hypothetical protein
MPTVVKPCIIPKQPKLLIDPVPKPGGVFIGSGDVGSMAKYFYLIGEREKAIVSCPYVKEAPDAE